MGERGTVEVTVELEPGAGPIKGRVRDITGKDESFTGWLELSTSLEQARQRATAIRSAPRGEDQQRRTSTPGGVASRDGPG